MKRFALSLLCLAGAAHAEVPLTRAPDGLFTVPVRVGAGARADFVIDTGAAGCGVSAKFAAERRLPAVGPASEKRVRAPSMTLDGHRVGALDCVVLPDRHDGVAGVVGADMLSQFVVVFDMRRSVMSLHGGAQHGQALVNPRARLVDAGALPSGLLAVPVRLNSARGVAVLDTGARRSAFNARFARAAGVDDGAPARSAFELAGRGAPIETRIQNLPAFAALGIADRPAMILGLDRLAGLRLVIDYPRNRVWFDPG